MRQRYENESHSQLCDLTSLRGDGCFLCVKDTKMKAIHNHMPPLTQLYDVVFYASKIRK